MTAARKKLLVFGVCALWACASFAVELRLPEEFVPLSFEPAAAESRTWRQYGEIQLAYAAARSRVALALRRQGWIRIKTVDYDLVRWKSLEIWERGGERILLQFWREEVARTGFAWGILDNGKQS